VSRNPEGWKGAGASGANGSRLSKQEAAAAGVVADIEQELTAGSICADEEACVMVCL